MSLRRAVVRLVILLTLLVGGRSMQAQSANTLRGTVTDSAGGAVAGIEVTLLRSGNVVAHTHASRTGEFHFDALAPGHYDLTTPAFQGLAAKDLSLAWPAPHTPVLLVLAPATVVANVEVNAGQALSTAAADNKNTVAFTGKALNSLPVFDQNPIATLSAFLDPAATASRGVSIIVDGVELKEVPVTASGIADMRINGDPYSAEFSNPGRGRIEITTKPGAPQYYGTFNFLFRDSRFNGRNFFAPVRAPEQRRIYEGNITGPIGHGGHTTFFVSGAERDEDLQNIVHAVGPPGQLGFDASGIFDANVPAPDRHLQLNGRVTHDFSDAHRVSLSYDFYHHPRINQNVGGTVLPEAGNINDYRGDEIFFIDRLIFSPNLIQQMAIVLEKDEGVVTSINAAPSIQVQGSFTTGGAQDDLNHTENTIHLTDIVSWTHGRHYVRFGVSSPLQLSRRAIDDGSDRLGTFFFNSVQDFQNAAPYQFTIQQGTGHAVFWFNPIDGFVQDEYSVRKNLQLTAGIRYQWQTYLSDRHDFAPRFSFAWSPGRKWVVRGGSGLFYDRFGGDFAGTFKLHNGIVLRQIQLLNPGYPNALPPGESYAAFPSNLVRESPTLQAPRNFEYSAGIERQLGPALTATATYRGSTGIHIFRSRDPNAPLPPDFSARPDPSVGFVQQLESEGRSRLNALDLGLHGRVENWFEGQVQYTLSRSDDDSGGLSWFPQNQYEPSAEWGRSDFDRLQRFNLLATLRPGRWISLGVAAQLDSGSPYTELAGSDFFNTGLGNARPAGVGRNTLQTTGTADLDLSWNHDFHLTPRAPKDHNVFNVGLSAFNVLNHTNLAGFVGNVRSPLFEQATTALPARQMQLQVRYEF